ncbi:MAG: phosphoglucomutase [Thermodesulfobacteriota bacterium]|nr:phosphoglucomutase [Thermodesulfobacteriota bacterium]
MNQPVDTSGLCRKYIVYNDHAKSDYFALIKELVAKRNECPEDDGEYSAWQTEIDRIYELVLDELKNNQGKPITPVKFGTSGWRGIIGKDVFRRSVSMVTESIVQLYHEMSDSKELKDALGVKNLAEARERGAVVGHDNRFGGKVLAGCVTNVLTSNGFKIHYAGEATTGTLSAAVLELNAAFSVNLTPSHNPLQYGGFKYNAADAGPAAPVLTNRITANAQKFMSEDKPLDLTPNPSLVKSCDALKAWISLVRKGCSAHGLDYDRIMADLAKADDVIVAVDCVHGASRIHIQSLFQKGADEKLLLVRANEDPTFGGIAPEPSHANIKKVTEILKARPEKFKIGAIIDPDGDRIRFTDGVNDLSMNHFGAMAYHFLHETKKKKGMVAKTVATSNFANGIAATFGEEVFEPKVGFKEFKPVIDRALVCFEESDGITLIGHTPEKDAYIGLLAALDMVLTLGMNLGDYRTEIEKVCGNYFPDRDGITVSAKGEELKKILASLEKYKPGATIKVGDEDKPIAGVIDIDGRKMILEDGSWLMIRPSGTEPKVRFYVEARTEAGKDELFAAAKSMLKEIGLL